MADDIRAATGADVVAVAGLSRSVAESELTINNLLPGTFDTDRLQANLQALAKSTSREVAAVTEDIRSADSTRRFGQPDEFGAACAFLCSAQAGYITVQKLLIDPGAFPGLLRGEWQAIASSAASMQRRLLTIPAKQVVCVSSPPGDPSDYKYSPKGKDVVCSVRRYRFRVRLERRQSVVNLKRHAALTGAVQPLSGAAPPGSLSFRVGTSQTHEFHGSAGIAKTFYFRRGRA